jgi:ribosomal protein S18 acetylase RimI-like enzyme
MTLTIHQANASDWTAINEFIDEAYGPIAPFKSFARWSWQFVANPFRDERRNLVPVWLAKDAERIVGQIAVQPASVRIDGQEHPAGWMVDVIVLPEYRNQSLGHRLHSVVAAAVPTLTMITMAPATRRMALRQNCVTLGPVQEFAKFVNLDGDIVRRHLLARMSHRPLVNFAIKSACYISGDCLLAGALNAFARWREVSSHREHPDITIDEITVFDGEIEDFWARVSNSYPAIFSRNTKFLNWRFVNVPNLNYRLFAARRSGQCVGYIVLRRTTAVELAVGVIVDLLTMPNDVEVAGSLIDHALFTFGKGIAAVDCVASHPAIIRLLRERGFLPLRTVYPTVVCQEPLLRERIYELKDRWYFTKGDHDWDQVNPV